MNFFILLFTGFTIGISGAMIPGTLTLFTISEVLKRNRLAGLQIISGHILLEIALMWVIVLGFQRFVIVENFMLTVSIIGGAALIAMGGILFLAARNMRLPDMKTEARFDKGLVFGGIFFSLISPGFLAWWATIGISTVVRALLFGIFGISVLALGHFIADVLWYWLLSYATVKGKQHLTRRSYQNAMRLFAVLLVFLGFRFLTNLSSPALR